MLEGDCPSWIHADITPHEIREVAISYTCPVCVLSKRRAKSVAVNLNDPEGFYGGINSKNAKPGQIISIDPVGPISPKSIDGFLLCGLFTTLEVPTNGSSFLRPSVHLLLWR